MALDIRTQGMIRDLGDGLILRSATVADAEALADFNARIHGNRQTGEPGARHRAWAWELAARPHPTFQVSDFTLVEDTSSRRIGSRPKGCG